MTLIPSSLRSAVVQRAQNCCEYCRLSQELQVATFPVDHVVPVARDGKTILENLALACFRCNALKWLHTEATDPTTGKTVSLFNPRTQMWLEHFRWSRVDPAFLEGLTPEGRATITFLDLNSASRVAIRKWLMVVGKHP